MTAPVDGTRVFARAGNTMDETVRRPFRSSSDAEPFDDTDDVELSPEEEEEEDAPETAAITDEDAQSLIGVSISQVATHYASQKTPAIEKAAVLAEDWNDGRPVESDEDSTPSATPGPSAEFSPILDHAVPPRAASPEERRPNRPLTALPSSQPLRLPSPFQAEAKPKTGRSALQEAFFSTQTKRRSLSGSGDAIRKLLPSMPNVGLLFNLPSTSLFSNASQKTRSRPPSPETSREASSPKLPSRASTLPQKTTSVLSQGDGTQSRDGGPATRQRTVDHNLRRVASEDSTLYQTISRASSLGDDTRFENHHEMINSRVKAIVDSLQERSSFRLPTLSTLPSIPSMQNFSIPGFSGAMKHFATGTAPSRLNIEADLEQDILPGIDKKKPSENSHSAAGSAKPAFSEAVPEQHIHRSVDILDRAIENLTGDVVIMGGYRGSILRSAKPPHRQLWVPVKVGLNLRKVNLEVGLNPEDEENMEKHIFASGMLQHIGPVDISRRLFKRFRDSPNGRNGTLRVWDFGYDWRLSPHLLSKKLVKYLEGLPSNNPANHGPDRGALVIAHSLGGLITRHAVNMRPELFSGVVYAGVPQACVNILGPIRNGDDVLLSSRVLTAQVNFTLRTTFALLPLEGYCFMDKTTKEPYTVDFFNLDDWIKYRWSPCTDPPLPPKNPNGSALSNILRTSSLTNLPLPLIKGPSVNSRKSHSHRHTAGGEHTTTQQQPQTVESNFASRIVDGIEDAARTDRTIAPQMGSMPNPVGRGQSINSSVSTAVTLPRADAIAYLRRTLAEVKQFKEELAHNDALESANRYPPLAVIYCKSIPTVYGAKVDGRDGIACADSYDDLAFASGDGVCLAREAMLPEGYRLVQGGRIKSDRGHVTLLGDLTAVGRAIEAVTRGRAKGLGLGSAPHGGAGTSPTALGNGVAV